MSEFAKRTRSLRRTCIFFVTAGIQHTQPPVNAIRSHQRPSDYLYIFTSQESSSITQVLTNSLEADNTRVRPRWALWTITASHAVLYTERSSWRRILLVRRDQKSTEKSMLATRRIWSRNLGTAHTLPCMGPGSRLVKTPNLPGKKLPKWEPRIQISHYRPHLRRTL